MMRFLGLLLLLAIGVLAFGFYRGWFDASTAEAGGKRGIQITWNTDKFKEDMDKAGSSIKSMSQSVVDKVKGKAKTVSATQSELEGRVTAVDSANDQVTLDVDGEPITLVVPETPAAEQRSLEDLKGKDVRVTLEKVGETMVVRAIEEK
jgi:hypothetical protein